MMMTLIVTVDNIFVEDTDKNVEDIEDKAYNKVEDIEDEAYDHNINNEMDDLPHNIGIKDEAENYNIHHLHDNDVENLVDDFLYDLVENNIDYFRPY